MTPETAPERVHGHVQAHHLGCVLEHIKLLYPAHQSAHPHAYQPDEHAPLPETAEEALRFADEHMIECGIGYALLQRVRVEVGIAYAYRDARGQLLLAAQLIGQLLGHADDQLAEHHRVGGVAVKGVLGADRLLLGVADDRRVVYAVGFLPYLRTVLAHERLQHLRRYDTQGVYG